MRDLALSLFIVVFWMVTGILWLMTQHGPLGWLLLIATLALLCFC